MLEKSIYKEIGQIPVIVKQFKFRHSNDGKPIKLRRGRYNITKTITPQSYGYL